MRRPLQLLLLVVLLAIAGGCPGDGPAAARATTGAVRSELETPPPAEAPKNVAESDQRLELAEARNSALRHQLAVSDADLATEKGLNRTIHEEEDQKRERAKLAWFAGVLLFLAIADVVLCIAVSSTAKVTGPLAVALFAAAAIAMVFRALVGWLALVGGVLGLGFVGYAIWLARHRDRKASTAQEVAKQAIDHGERLVATLRGTAEGIDQQVVERVVAEVKRSSAIKQVGAGVRDELDRLRGKPANRPLPLIPPAATSIVHALPGPGVAAPRPLRAATPASEAPTEKVPVVPAPSPASSGSDRHDLAPLIDAAMPAPAAATLDSPPAPPGNAAA